MLFYDAENVCALLKKVYTTFTWHQRKFRSRSIAVGIVLVVETIEEVGVLW